MQSDPESKHILVIRRGQFYYFDVSRAPLYMHPCEHAHIPAHC